MSAPRSSSRRLLGWILAGIAAGAVTGGFWPDAGRGVAILGDVFLNLLMMLVVPLVVCSMITGVTALGDLRRLGSIGWRTVLYYMTTTLLAVSVGILLVTVVRPGRGVVVGEDVAEAMADRAGAARDRDVGSIIREVVVGDRESGRQGLVPRNAIGAMARMEILPLIVFSLLLGASLSAGGDRTRAAIDLVGALNDAIMRLVHWVMWVAPLGMFALIASRIGRAGGFSGFWPELAALGRYVLVVLGGLAFHAAVVLPLILRFVGRRQPLSYLRGVATALVNAFSTASSSATLPLTIQGVEEENDVSPRTASFVLPLGATINMDGTALYEAVAAIFLAQVYGVDLSAGAQVIIFLTATLAAIGAAGIPEAGLVTMVIVLSAVGLPVEGVALILTIDWLLDRFRTTVNVWGDSVGAAVIDRFERQPA